MSSIPWSISEDSLDVNFSVPQILRLRITRDCFASDWDQVRSLFRSDSGPARIQVWVDRAVSDANPAMLRHLDQRLSESRGQLELVSPIQCIEGGEQAKNDESTVNHIFQTIDRDGLDRRSYVVVIGGGALLDAVGYAAAISHRGIRLVRFPTTTLAQADSGVGVKNAINAFAKKNWKGTFAVPWGVVNDQSLLAHLPDRDFRSGFSEAVKVAMLKSPSAFRYLCQHAPDIAIRDWTAVMPAIRSSVLMHLHHITHGGDPFEMQEARPLDFGHWSAHKLEQLTKYDLRHGEAVSIGVALDTLYSHLVLGLDRQDAMMAVQALLDLGLPIHHPMLESDVVFDGLEEFRQHLGGRLTLTMVKSIGQSVSVHEVDRMAMTDAIALLRNLQFRSNADRSGISSSESDRS
ncbi:MAG: 3-dehydroquinate synthase [Planctomycetota bacterium]|jgi:3-dehydroquinate synthase